MIKKIQFEFAIFIMIVISNAASGQVGWNKTYKAERSTSVNFDDIQYHKDHLIIRGNAYLNEDSIWCFFLCSLDTNGLVLWQQTICDSTKSFHTIANTPSRLAINENIGFIGANNLFGTGDLVLCMTDVYGNDISLARFTNVEKTIFPLDILVVNGKYYIFGHVQRNNYMLDIYMIRTDTLGNFEWIKYYGTTQYHENFGDVINNGDGRFTIAGNLYTDNFSLKFDDKNWCRPWIFTIDTEGNLLKEWLGDPNDERTLGGGPFYKLQNGDFIQLSRDFRQAPFPYDEEWRASPTITRLDSNYNLKWKRNMTDFEERFDKFVDLEYSPTDNTFVTAGDIYVKYGPNYYESEIWVVKFNEDGDILWNITDTVYFNRQERHYTAGLTIAPSGSIYVAGYVDILGDEGWIMKVTPDGCTDTICTITSVADQFEMGKNLVRLYPNPSEDVFYVDVREVSDYTFLLCNIQGQPVLNQKLLKTTTKISHHLPPGMYFYSVFNNINQIFKSGKLVVTE